jgi:DNA invertase Pin-like site-specific DNA recombinase
MSTKAPVRCALYARYSSDQQRPTSIEDQVRSCREFASGRGWKVLDEFIFMDHAVTGTARDRSGLQALLDAALMANRPFDYVLIDDSSRLARDVVISVETVRQLKFNGVHIYAVAQNIDSARDDAEDFVILHGMMDARYVRDLAHKTHRGMAGQALKGRATGGKVFGYTTEAIPGSGTDAHGKPLVDGYDIVIEPSQARIVEKIFNLFVDGSGLHKIARALNDEHLPYPRRGDGNDGGGWSHTTVRALLRNERYIGRIIWNKTRWQKIPGSRKRRHVPRPESEWKVTERPELAIVTRELWEKAQARIRHVEQCFGERARGRFVKPANRAAAGSRYLFSGLLRCWTCGGNMTVVAGDKGGIDGRRYGCSKHFNMGAAVCANNLTIRTVVLDATIRDEVRDRLATPRKIEEAAEIFREELAAAVADVPDRAAETERALNRVGGEIANFVRAIASGVNAASIASALSKAEAERERLAGELAAAEALPKPGDIAIHPSAVRELIDNVTGALNRDVPAGREALRRYLGPITMRPVDQNGVRHYVAEGSLDATEALAGAVPDYKGGPGLWSRPAYVSVVAGA